MIRCNCEIVFKCLQLLKSMFAILFIELDHSLRKKQKIKVVQRKTFVEINKSNQQSNSIIRRFTLLFYCLNYKEVSNATFYLLFTVSEMISECCGLKEGRKFTQINNLFIKSIKIVFHDLQFSNCFVLTRKLVLSCSNGIMSVICCSHTLNAKRI